MQLKAIIFDFFGVICSEVAPFWLAQHLSSERSKEVKAELVGKADRGEISQQQMFDVLSSMTGVPADRIEGEWLKYVKIDDKVVGLARSLKGRFSLGLLTNSPAPFFRKIMSSNKSTVDGLFGVIVVSSENGVAKPDPEIYRITLARLGVEAGQACLIDDNPANVAGAIAVGMDAILFRSIDDLKSRHPWLDSTE